LVGEEFLYAVAQVGATYAGFSTLVAVVAYKGETGPIPARIYYMLLLSLMVVLASFLPLLVQYFGLIQESAWRIASGVYAVAWGSYWVNAIRTIRSRFGSIEGLSFLNRFNTYVVHPVSVSVLVLGFIGAWGGQVSAVYATTLFVMLYMSAYLFFQIVMSFLKDRKNSS
jgi:hypothetical protein